MAELNAVTTRAERPGEHQAPAKPDASKSLREQYFDCVASGQTQCTYSPSDKQNQKLGDKPANQAASPQTLEFTNPFTSDKPPTTPTPVDGSTVLPRTNWTVAINLTTTLDVVVDPSKDNSPLTHAGARNKAAQLLDLAESTKGKPLTLVVQNAEPDPHFHPSLGKATDYSSDEKSAPRNGMLLHSYLIHDGKIDELPVRPSAGIAADTQALLETAGKQAPSDRIALISQSHGGGPDGIEGDTGSATLEQVNSAIQNGLKGSGHDKLDVLDFDACSMGNSRVLTGLGQSARQIVASTETENAGATGADGQNERAMIQALIAKPDMTAAQLAAQTVKIADAGLNDDRQPGQNGQRKSGTNSLSQYDTSKIDQFNNAVSDLGNAMNTAWANEKNHGAIRADMDNTPLSTQREGHLGQYPGVDVRDAKTFATNLVRDIDRRTISDPDGNLRRAAEAMLTSRDALIPNYHGANQGGYDKQGGVSLFMPGNEFLDNQARAKENNNIARLADMTTDGKSAHLSSREYLLQDLDNGISAGKKAAGPQSAAAFAPLEQARQNLVQAKTEQEYKQALSRVIQESKQFLNTSAGRQVMSGTVEEMARNMNKTMQDQEDPTNTGWNNFLATLAADAPRAYR